MLHTLRHPLRLLQSNPYLLILLLPLAFGCICGGPDRYYTENHYHLGPEEIEQFRPRDPRQPEPPNRETLAFMGTPAPNNPAQPSGTTLVPYPTTPPVAERQTATAHPPTPLAVAGLRPGMHLWQPDAFPTDNHLARLGKLPGVLVAARVEPRFVPGRFHSTDDLRDAADAYSAGLLLTFRVEAEVTSDADPEQMTHTVRTAARAIASLIDTRTGQLLGEMTTAAQASERVEPGDDERLSRAREVTLTRATRDTLAGLMDAIQRGWPLR